MAEDRRARREQSVQRRIRPVPECGRKRHSSPIRAAVYVGTILDQEVVPVDQSTSIAQRMYQIRGEQASSSGRSARPR